jgi:hypothetical protein
LPELSVSDFKKFNIYLEGIVSFLFLKSETPQGLADFTASAVLDAASHRQL